MIKKTYLKTVPMLCIVGILLVSCSKNEQIQPVSALNITNPDAQSFATASTKITVAGSSLALGINGHPLDDGPYIATTAATQIKFLNGMNMTWYRVDVSTTTDGSITVPSRYTPLLAAAKTGKVNLLPMLRPRTLDLSDTEAESYQKGKTLGANFAAKYGSDFDYYDLGNDLDLQALLPNENGASQYDYDLTKFNVIAAYLKGMDTGIKSKDATAKTMVSAGWLHYAFLRMLDSYGVKFDVVAYHWYAEMEGLAPKAPYYIPDITLKLSNLFPTKPIWITEFNTRYKAASTTNESDQNTFINNFITKCKNNPQVKVAIVYELYNEPDKSTLEANYGIIKWTTPYTAWLKKLVSTNLTM